jgi:hypothetical protein
MRPTFGIRSVGFEIEGGWGGIRGVHPFPGQRLIVDGSINGQTLGDAPAIRAIHVGEITSPPILYTEDWAQWLLTHWPNAPIKDRSNRTCGFHIHLSTHNLKQYSMLTSKALHKEILLRLMALAKKVELPSKHYFWQRIAGLNRFCTEQFDAYAQMHTVHAGNRTNNVVRYGVFNFCWRLHGTLEFRALPTFRDAKIGVAFATAYLSTIEQFLLENADKTIAHETSLVF